MPGPVEVSRAIKALEEWHEAYDYGLEIGLDEPEAVRRADEYVRLGPDRRVTLTVMQDILSEYYLPPTAAMATVIYESSI